VLFFACVKFYFRPVLFNACDGTHWCGWENLVVRMANMVWASANEKSLCVVVNVSLFDHSIVFYKTWYRTQRKIDRHCAHIL